MVSLMSKGGELDRKLDAIEEPEDVKRRRISEDGVNDDDGGGGGGGGGSNDEKFSNSRVSDEARVSAMELDLGGAHDAEEVRVKGEEVKVENSSVDEVEAQNEESELDDDRHGEVEKGTTAVSQYNSLLSEFDDFVANENSGQIATSRALRYGFEVGDMVWGKVKSHPWWPGHIFNDAFASPQVRRTRREGHVLVAFFGDSSYGWFDPAELIPFDSNFAEKSRQTSSRTFHKAVDEAVDEVSRRCGLGLACKCRNQNNFIPTSVQGYFIVDVPDYEPSARYSAIQIRKARDSCRPSEMLSFIKQLALSPCVGDEKNLSFVKNRATIFAFRKAVFEEFDETYAQAFGVQSGRPSRDPVDSQVQPVKMRPRAPLSGPLVIAETLGGGTSATKHTKVKDNSKKDRYLFKRRDESGNLKGHQTSQGQASSSAPPSYVEGSGDGDFVLQKRTSAVSLKPPIQGKQEQTGFVSMTGADSSSHGRESLIIDQAAPSSSLATQDVTEDTKPSVDKRKEEVKGEPGSVSDRVVVPNSMGTSDLSGNGTLPGVIDVTSQSFKQDGEGLAEFKREENVKMSGTHEDVQQSQDGSSLGGPSPTGAKRSSGPSTGGGVKKAKVKRPLEESKPENSMTEGKKRKKKKQLGSDSSFRDPQKNSVSKKTSPSMGKSGVKSTHIGLAPKEESKKIAACSNNLSDSVGTSPLVGIGNVELELPELLSDLQALALDPFHGIERNSPAIVRKFFLRFRSLVYQKSLVLSPPSETESVEVRSSKSSIGVGASENNSTEHVRDLPSSRQLKPSLRSDDPTIAGRKRAPSDRQEEIAVKRSKKISDIKSLAAEKKATQKTSEAQRGEGKESAVPLVRKNKPDSAKKFEHPARAVEPTMLVMKFPPKISLPSPAELKARFARFGPMDQAGLRVFWKSSTCRVVFLHKSDAQAACKYAVSNNSLFGNFSVRCYVREVGAPGPEAPESVKGQGDDIYNDTPRVNKDPAVLQRASMPQPQPAIQLKSCLKKSTGEESGQATSTSGSSKGATARVKFMLAGEESTSRVDQPAAGNRNISNNANYADNGAPPSSSSSVAMDFSIRNFQKLVPSPSPSSILPLPPQFAKAPLNNIHHHPEIMAPRNTPTAPPTIDISQQMLSLLTRCNDVVTNVTGLLGYVPYHPL